MNVIFCGNPGHGKSTIINCILQDIKCESGISVVTGMTTEYSIIKYNGNTYIDTPGLADVKTREKSAKQIAEALKLNGKYKIIFVIQPNSGRICDDDLSTILAICDAIKTEVTYGVIFNKVSPVVRNLMIKNTNKYIDILPTKPEHFCILNKIPDAEDACNYLLDINMKKELMAFIDTVKHQVIKPLDVKDIDTRNFETRLKNVRIAFYTSMLRDKQNTLNRMQNKLDKFIDENRKHENTLLLKQDQINNSKKAINNNIKQIENIQKEIKNTQIGSVAACAGAGAIGGAALVATGGLSGVVAMGVSGVVGLYTRSKNNLQRQQINSLSMVSSNISNNIYSYNTDIERTNEIMQVTAGNVNETKNEIIELQTSIKEIERSIREYSR